MLLSNSGWCIPISGLVRVGEAIVVDIPMVHSVHAVSIFSWGINRIGIGGRIYMYISNCG